MISGILRLAPFAILLLIQPATASTFQVLHAFGDGSVKDGVTPDSDLSMDANGNIFGSTQQGGNFFKGIVFKYSTKGQESIVYSFGASSSDANQPEGTLVLASDGNIYGTTHRGGKSDMGTIYRMSLKGKEKVLYSFKGGKDGNQPDGGLTLGSSGALFGPTQIGGQNKGGQDNAGTLFSITPSGSYEREYTFCKKSFCADGFDPFSGLTDDGTGNLYGTTRAGGDNSRGTIFMLSSSGKYQVIHSFGNTINDGSAPQAELVRDSSGNMYGTASSGGQFDGGTIFKLKPNGDLTVLYAFCTLQSCADGQGPRGRLYIDKDGNFFGTTSEGGSHDFGTVFELDKSGVLTTLYSFADTGDGVFPDAGLVADKNGTLYGVASSGGQFDAGTLFSITP